MIDQQYIFIYKLNHADWMKTEGDTIFSHGNNVKHSPNDGPIICVLIPSLIKQIGQELSKIQYFDNITNKYKQSLLAQYKVPNLQVK